MKKPNKEITVSRSYSDVGIHINSNLPINRMTLIRLISAILVLVSHLDWIAGNSTDDFRRLGLYGVAIFFGLSGFLLTDSIFRNGANANFARNRILRIFPGLMGVLVLTSFIFAPLQHMISNRKIEYLFTFDNIRYIFQNVTTFNLQSDINGSLKVGHVHNWNPPLWTLSYELICYFLLFILVKLLGSRFIYSLPYILPAFIAFYLLKEFSIIQIPSRVSFLAYYSSFFFFGSSLYIKKLHLKSYLIFVLIPIILLSNWIPRKSSMDFFDIRDFVIGLILIPISLILSFNPKVYRKYRNDYSFGFYLYAAPISQLLILNFSDIRKSWVTLTICIICVTFMFAWLSWFIIEKPALKLKKRLLI